MTRKETIEKAANKYLKEMVTPLPATIKVAFTTGAEWADAHPFHNDALLKEFEKNRLEHCDNITEEQYNLESNFVTSHIEKHHRSPAFIDAIEYGTEKGKEEMLEKAIEWLKEHSWDYLIGDNFKDEKMISDFKKAMEE